MQLAILAFVFGVLLFLMSAAALSLEAMSDASRIWRVALWLLASLHAAAGFMAIGGAPAYNEGRWGTAATAAVAAASSTVAATFVAFQLAGYVNLGLSQSDALYMVAATLLAGLASLGLVMMLQARKTTN